MYYGSPLYLMSLLFLISAATVLWIILRKCNRKTQKIVILALMLVNVFQHLFKSLIYPQHFGTGFTAISTAYNMCAVLILFSPFAFICHSRFSKNFVYYVGSIAGVAAIAVPYWFIGKDISEIGWEYVRFFFCHILLFLTSILPLLLGMHKAAYKEFWQVGLGFFLALCVIVVNDIVFICMGLYPGTDPANLYCSLLELNPCLLMGPTESLPWITDFVRILSPAFLCGENPTGLYVPILWYAIPGYVGISLISATVFTISDHQNIISDVKKFYPKICKKSALQ